MIWLRAIVMLFVILAVLGAPASTSAKLAPSLGADVTIERNVMGDVQRLAQHGAGAKAWEVKLTRDVYGQEIDRQLPGGARSYWWRDELGRPTQHWVGQGKQLARGRRYQQGDDLAQLHDSARERRPCADEFGVARHDAPRDAPAHRGQRPLNSGDRSERPAVRPHDLHGLVPARVGEFRSFPAVTRRILRARFSSKPHGSHVSANGRALGGLRSVLGRALVGRDVLVFVPAKAFVRRGPSGTKSPAMELEPISRRKRRRSSPR